MLRDVAHPLCYHAVSVLVLGKMSIQHCEVVTGRALVAGGEKERDGMGRDV